LFVDLPDAKPSLAWLALKKANLGFCSEGTLFHSQLWCAMIVRKQVLRESRRLSASISS
jgi:hypothetical protein